MQHKRTRLTQEQNMGDIHADCWTLIIDYVDQYTLAALALTNVQLNNLVTPTVQLIFEFVRSKSTLYYFSSDIININDDETIREDEINKDTVSSKLYYTGEESQEEFDEPYELDELDEGDCFGASTMKTINGKLCAQEEENCEQTHHYDKILQILPHIKEGDVVKPTHCDYRNEGKEIAHNGKFWTFSTNVASDYGTIPSFFPLEKFPIRYFSNVNDYHTRTIKVNKKNLVQCSTEKDLERCRARHHENACKENCLHSYRYYVRVTYKEKQFNLQYRIVMEEIEPIQDYISGDAVNYFCIG
jgi:hypothetical protein